MCVCVLQHRKRKESQRIHRNPHLSTPFHPVLANPSEAHERPWQASPTAGGTLNRLNAGAPLGASTLHKRYTKIGSYKHSEVPSGNLT